MTILLHLAVLAATILILSRILPGVRIRSPGSAVIVAITFSVLNFFLGWLIRALLFVPAVLTLGLLFLFIPLIVNALVLWVTDKALASFEITSVRSLFLAAIVITLVNWLFYAPHFQSMAWGHPNGIHAAPTWI